MTDAIVKLQDKIQSLMTAAVADIDNAPMAGEVLNAMIESVAAEASQLPAPLAEIVMTIAYTAAVDVGQRFLMADVKGSA